MRARIAATSSSESQFERQVKQLAALFGYAYYHTWRSIHSPDGYPDCCLAKPGRLVFIELKSEKGKVSDKQQEWLDTLEAAGAEAYVFRPSQFDELVEILRNKPRSCAALKRREARVMERSNPR